MLPDKQAGEQQLQPHGSPPPWLGSCIGVSFGHSCLASVPGQKTFLLAQLATNRAAGATWWWIPAWPHSAKGQAWCNFFCPDITFPGKRQPRFGGTPGWPALLGTFGTRSLQVMAAWQRKLERRVHFPLGYKGWPSLPIALPKGPAECVVRPQRLYPFAFHRILIKEGFTCFISAPTSKPAVIQPGSQAAVRSIERWVVEPRKYSIHHKPETTLYCPHLTFSSSQLFLEFFPTAELHLPWKSLSALLHVLFHSPCANTDDGRQHFPIHISNSLFLLLHFQAAPWAGS